MADSSQALPHLADGSSSSGDSSEEQQGVGKVDEWSDWGDEDSGVTTKSLFSSQLFPSAVDAMNFDAAEHGFDLRAVQQQKHLSQVAMIKCINYIRRNLQLGENTQTVLKVVGLGEEGPMGSEDYLQPVLDEDGLLLFDFEGDAAAEESSDSDEQWRNTGGPSPDQELAQLRDENEALRLLLQQTRQQALPPELQQDADAAADELQAPSTASPSAGHIPFPRGQKQHGRSWHKRGSDPKHAEVDDSYFESYGSFSIHRDMLSDKVRMDAYERALKQCLSLMPGAAVLDVGCGTSILSLFAARAGAATVIGVEASRPLAEMAEQICAANRLSQQDGGPVTIIAGQVEHLTELPVQQVDVLVSEWMGYALLFESMLASVIHARDRWLRPGGVMLPHRACLHVAGVAAGTDDLAYWDDVSGFSMAPVRKALHARRLHHVAVTPVAGEDDVITSSAQLHELDLLRMHMKDADFSAEFQVYAENKVARECSAVALWFTVDFGGAKGDRIQMSTSPFEPPTHWAQALLTLRQPVLLQSASASLPSFTGQSVAAGIQGRVSFARGNRHRSLDISLEYAALGPDGRLCGDTEALMYDMASE